MRVLIVDDDDDYRKLAAAGLRMRGHHVDELASPFGLCNRVAGRDGPFRAPPDVVVLDFHLPGLSCAAALRLLELDPLTRKVPIVVHSAADERDVRALMGTRRLRSFVQKTGRIRLLAEEVERAGMGAAA